MRVISAVLAVGLIMTYAGLFPLAGPARADRGPIVWHEGVKLSQDSQKAIILHNSDEEVLILGTELKANKETEVLEFIPFPAEPKVSLAKGNPFDEVARLIQKKGVVFQFDNFDFGKGGGAGRTTAPVEIRLSEKIGLHDVTAIKINDIEQFSRWLEDFFKSKGIRADREKLHDVYRNARDYLQRGYSYFVFDSVKVSEKLMFLEPLVYRFKTDKVYYPLKTSNLIGGTGAVELILVLPGSVSDDIWQTVPDVFVRGPGRDILLSSSSKVYPREVAALHGSEPFFAKGAKIYLQVFKYKGNYDFKDDFTYRIERLVPYAYRYVKEGPLPGPPFEPPLTSDETRDFREAFCLQNDPLKDRIFVDRSVLNCGNFIPNDEYEVYAALFRKSQMSGIPSRDVVIEATTTEKEYKGKNIDKSIDDTIVKHFNEVNRVAYPLENAFPQDEKLKISIRNDKEDNSPFLRRGKTWVSRAGFNKERTRALVYVSHVAGPRSGVGYFVTLEKDKGEWAIAGFHLGIIF